MRSLSIDRALEAPGSLGKGIGMELGQLVPEVVTAVGITPLDVAAFLWFLACTFGYNRLTSRGPLHRASLLGAIQLQRRQWMSNMAVRTDRFIDIVLLGHLAGGHTFFASTSVILLGGLAALLGSGDRVAEIIARLPWTAPSTAIAFDLKILVLIAIFVYAFFKFAWAFRLAHYALILVGSTPVPTTEAAERCREHAERTAEVAGLSAEHGNLGLRAYYFAIAGIAWFFHPLLFIAGTTFVLLVIVRREYLSRTRRAIAGLVRSS